MQLFQGLAVFFITFSSVKEAPSFISNEITKRRVLSTMIVLVGILTWLIFLILPIAVILVCSIELVKDYNTLSRNYFIVSILLQLTFLLRTYISDSHWLTNEFKAA